MACDDGRVHISSLKCFQRCYTHFGSSAVAYRKEKLFESKVTTWLARSKLKSNSLNHPMAQIYQEKRALKNGVEDLWYLITVHFSVSLVLLKKNIFIYLSLYKFLRKFQMLG